MKNPDVSVVIPALNEEKNIGKAIKSLQKAMKGIRYECIVVDNKSSDRTASIAKELGAKTYSFGFKGKGDALRYGFAKSKGRIIVSMDADLSNRPEEIKLMVDAIDLGYDVCMGSRFIIGGGSGDISFLRKLGNKFFVFLVNNIYKSNYTDLCYGYRAFKSAALKKLDLDEDGFGIETEMSIKSVKRSLDIIEIPSFEKPRSSGESNLRTFRDGYLILKTIIKNI